jgi:hypothetical protein
LRVGAANDRACFPVSFRLDLLEIAFLLAFDPGRFTLALRTEAVGDPAALGDHTLVHLTLDLLDIVDPLELDIEDLYTQVAGPGLGDRQDFLAYLVPPKVDFFEAFLVLGFHLRLLRHAISASNQLDEVVFSYGVSRLAVENIVQPCLRPAFVAQPLKEQQWVGDLPARVRVDPDEPLVFCGQLVGVTVPLQEPLVETVHFLNEWDFKTQPWRRYRGTCGFTELRDDDLLRLLDDIHRAP